jgi:2-C-methyl-D-erythritol 4-phosphate cytidylyltransferase
MPDPVSPDPPAISAVVVAAGSGSRIGADRNKVLLPLAGEPLLAHTLRHLSASAAIGEIVIVCRPVDEAAMRRIVLGLGALPAVRFAPGGALRGDSVRNGVEAATAREIVMIHDAARPFVGKVLLAALVKAAREDGAAIPGLPLVDTVKRVADDRVVATVERGDLVAAQTPQAFAIDDFREALADSRATSNLTDDASIYERLGRKVRIVAGDALNLKITTPTDLLLAPRLLEMFREREGIARGRAGNPGDRR